MMKRWLLFVAGTMITLFTLPAFAAANEVLIAGIPIEFIFFALTLLCVALFHNYTFYVAITGLAVITTYKTVVTGFKSGAGLIGLTNHIGHEWVTLANLFCLLMGFAILARHFEKGHKMRP